MKILAVTGSGSARPLSNAAKRSRFRCKGTELVHTTNFCTILPHTDTTRSPREICSQNSGVNFSSSLSWGIERASKNLSKMDGLDFSRWNFLDHLACSSRWEWCSGEKQNLYLSLVRKAKSKVFSKLSGTSDQSQICSVVQSCAEYLFGKKISIEMVDYAAWRWSQDRPAPFL